MNAQHSIPDLLDRVAHLDRRDFDAFFQKILTLRAQRVAPVLVKEEAELLKKINRGFPQEKWLRLDALNEKVEEESLTETEHVELLILVEEYEKYTVQRLRLLGKLAELRKVPLNELMNQLGLTFERHG